MTSAVSRVLSAIDRRTALTRREFPKTPDWVQAPPELQQVLDDSAVGEQANPAPSVVSWKRGATYDGVCGLLRMRRGMLLSAKADRVETFGDVHARTVTAFGQFGRPVNFNTNRASIRDFIRCGGLKAVINRPDADKVTLLLGAHYGDCNNYFHFWADTICDLWFAIQLGLRRDETSNYVMAFGAYPWQQEILAMCGIPFEKVVPLSSFVTRRFSELVIPLRPKGGRTNPGWLVRAAREIAEYSTALNAPTSGGKIYVSRRDSNVRRLVNEVEVTRMLEGMGFRSVTCSGLTVREQQQLFANADVIVASHGAALTNLIWCRPGTRVIEFLPVEHANPCFHDISRLAGLDYSFVPSRLVDPRCIPLTGSVRVSLDELRRVIEAASLSAPCKAHSLSG